jgi:hypothetical protein
MIFYTEFSYTHPRAYPRDQGGRVRCQRPHLRLAELTPAPVIESRRVPLLGTDAQIAACPAKPRESAYLPVTALSVRMALLSTDFLPARLIDFLPSSDCTVALCPHPHQRRRRNHEGAHATTLRHVDLINLSIPAELAATVVVWRFPLRSSTLGVMDCSSLPGIPRRCPLITEQRGQPGEATVHALRAPP